MPESPEINILVIHGPNMNLVGKRPNETFGTLTLDKIDRSWKTREMKLKYYAQVYELMGNKEKANEYWQRILNFYPDDGKRNQFQQLASTKLRQ